MSGESGTTELYAIGRNSANFNPTGAATASTGFGGAPQISPYNRWEDSVIFTRHIGITRATAQNTLRAAMLIHQLA